MIPKPSQIKPATSGDTKFFSKRLHDFARRKGARYMNVYRVGPGPKSSLLPGQFLVIGFMDEDGWINGARMMRVLCGSLKTWAFAPNYWGKRKITDITESFWKEYLRIGVCAIHDSSHAWNEGARVRTCLRCGVKQRAKVVVRRETVWRNAA